MNWLTSKIRKFYHKEIDGIGLALFRISFCLMLILEIIHTIYFKGIIYGTDSIGIALNLWLGVVFLIMIGAFTRIMTIANYLLCITLITQQINHYHMDYAYFGVSFLFLFLPISRSVSIDNLLLKLKYSNTRRIFNPSTKVSSLAYFLPLLIGFSLIYLDSALNWKVISPIWMKGLGMWLPGSTPYLVHADLSIILNQKYLNLFCGYLTIVFEIGFIFLMWFKKLRYVLTIIGLGLHIGIFIFFPIPVFAIGMSCFYFLLVPLSFWKKFSFSNPNKEFALKFYYDNECPLCLRTRIIIEHFDIFNNVKFLSVQGNAQNEKAFSNIPSEELLINIYSVNKSGKVYMGVNTYIQVLFALRYTYLIGLIIHIPGIYHLGKFLYGKIALSRYTERCTEESCAVPNVLLPVNYDNQKIFMKYTFADFKIDFIKYGLIGLLFIQFCISWDKGLMSKISDGIGINKNFILRKFGSNAAKPAKIFFGLGYHAVYMDYAYYGYEVKITYIGKNNEMRTLPIIKDDGLAGEYLYGPNYVAFLFYCVNKNALINGNDLVSTFDEDTFNKGLTRWINFWAKKQKIKPLEGTFSVLLKEFKIPQQWEKNALKNAIKQPWKEIGTFTWNAKDNIRINYNKSGKEKLGEKIVNDL